MINIKEQIYRKIKYLNEDIFNLHAFTLVVHKRAE